MLIFIKVVMLWVFIIPTPRWRVVRAFGADTRAAAKGDEVRIQIVSF